MISVETALEKILALATVTEVETAPLADAAGRVLAQDVAARRDQPPFPSSAMDGYALRAAEAAVGARFDVVGTSAAGHGFAGTVGPGQAVRIFTGAPVPDGADRVVIQEDVTRDGDRITLSDTLGGGPHVRPLGVDFRTGDTVAAPRLLRPEDVALLAAMNIPEIPVRRRPVVALIATGDELVMPGETPAPDQIIASNSFGLKAMLEAAGAEARLLPIARDNAASLKTAFALAEEADLIVTIGGASVGDHDLVAPVAEELGLERAFYKVAMRPGKPLMAGRLGGAAMLGLPGNPVSAMVCGQLFMLPLVRAMMGLPHSPAPRRSRPLEADIGPNGPREHYMRARLTETGIAAFDSQDSSLLTVLAEADALLVRPPGDGARKAGTLVDYIAL
ncbi:molybdopterin molybdotransferase MoeA [Psychromarinibacter sp. C21-152]|uniref:Molybdopterin molybdenumtransferase n=1 Tax=Psychromarinibacter sediminicola TaxID=3033385 RepID=A0AAE3NKC6_9RHOB|nr:gephyrin-like molybdotransferase Glp [Psychromarinibacter sediminicola]MDF0599478.1 molybdopterin molybdotransferase MoeA [Psychromarinibacter sediminicola]